jgi:rhodanese-related sulfurtransferase
MNRNAWIGSLALVALSVCSPTAHAQLGDLLGLGPSIEVISTSDLATMLKDQVKGAKEGLTSDQSLEKADFVLVDVRSEPEVKVSVIPGAITKAQFEKDREKYRGRTVIPYCTVGGRSGAYAKQLAKEGVTVKNYKGSILEWVNNELPVVTLEGKPTNRVHTYSNRHRIPAKYEQVTD